MGWKWKCGGSQCVWIWYWLGQYAADYTVNMPVDASASSIFLATCASSHSLSLVFGPGPASAVADMMVAFYRCGLNIPLILIESLGAAYMTTLPARQAKYNEDGVGGLIAAGLSPLSGFGQFLSLNGPIHQHSQHILHIFYGSNSFKLFRGSLSQYLGP